MTLSFRFNYRNIAFLYQCFGRTKKPTPKSELEHKKINFIF